MSIARELKRRRTFAIISHPDAGKTTLTEKLLLYGGAVNLAGSVTSRRNARATTSDWMELERQRGISVSSTVLQFEYAGCCFNLLDTPGHNDFSEDTYRVLMAVDSVVMVIDAGKGIEPQTRKLFEVCRYRGIPIFTFMNKCDRPTLEPLALVDDLERTLQIRTFAATWPVGNGPEFRGVYDRVAKRLSLFARNRGGAARAEVTVRDLADPQLAATLGADVLSRTGQELQLLDGAGDSLDMEAVAKGDMTPIYFGSAISNFGVEVLLDALVTHAPPPGSRLSTAGVIPPDRESFSGFIFKIQSNMNPKHRDRIAFLRICSGQFRRDMQVHHSGSGETVRLSSSHRVFARDRESVAEAWPGDVIGIVGHDRFRIGDTLSEDPAVRFPDFPRFAPECFAFVHRASAAEDKRFRAGMEDLLREGLAQAFVLNSDAGARPVLGAVGRLQFEVLQYRLKAEYGADCYLDFKPWTVTRWVAPESEKDFMEASVVGSGRKARDAGGMRVALFESEWDLRYFSERHPKIVLATSGGAPARDGQAELRWSAAPIEKAESRLEDWRARARGASKPR